MEYSKIEWCDHTFNPWEGCTKVSPGCAHCYAEARNARFAGGKATNWGKGAQRRRTSASNWAQPLKWNREEEILLNDHIINQRPRVFCASLADWLDDEVPIEWLADLLELIARTPELDWLLLTKRPENFRLRCSQASINLESRGLDHGWIMDWVLFGEVPKNIWIGTSVEDQTRADERIPALLKIPALVRFLSCEPLLAPVKLPFWVDYQNELHSGRDQRIQWVICGGESGLQARPMHPAWAISLRDQCKAASVPFLFKQWGEWTNSVEVELSQKPDIYLDDDRSDGIRSATGMWKVGKKAAGRELYGVEHNGFPEVRA